ncbi:MAG: hypothetical protein JWN89_300 [Parcubacteria group bacterium]|nr:hypothetical protein [Parcubacteria group bacterium]
MKEKQETPYPEMPDANKRKMIAWFVTIFLGIAAMLWLTRPAKAETVSQPICGTVTAIKRTTDSIPALYRVSFKERNPAELWSVLPPELEAGSIYKIWVRIDTISKKRYFFDWKRSPSCRLFIPGTRSI